RAVQQQRLIAPNAVHAEREQPCLKFCGNSRRIAFEPRIHVKPFVEDRLVSRNVLEIPIEEEVLTRKIDERSRLPFERLYCLPPAENLAQHASVVQKRPAGAEW